MRRAALLPHGKAILGKSAGRAGRLRMQRGRYYVPWFVHEYEEGKFDFTGELCPENDLHTWIQLTQKKGLLGFFRPGPYVYAETTDLGLPKWFSQKYRNAHVKGYQDGKYVDVGNEKTNVAHNRIRILIHQGGGALV